MTNRMAYKGYAARIEYDDEDGLFTGRTSPTFSVPVVSGRRPAPAYNPDTNVFRSALKRLASSMKGAWPMPS